MSIIDTLVTDRGPGAWYGAADLNRVGEAVQYLADLLNGRGYSVPVSPKMDWERADFPLSNRMRQYLADVAAIRNAIALPVWTPEAPDDMNRLTWQEANEIEQILVAVDQMLSNMAAAWLYSGDIFAGEV